MGERRSELARCWRILASTALLGLAVLASAAIVTARAGAFPDFVPMPGVSARGVAVDKTGNVYVSVGDVRAGVEYIQVRKFTPAGEQLSSTDVGRGTIGGLTITANGDLYIALAAGSDRGIYQMDAKGLVTLLPGTDQIFFANGLAFDDVGNLYVTESVSMTSPGILGQGGIWCVPRGGSPQPCVRDALLTGTGALGQPVPIGANGIAYFHGDLYITNTEKGTVLRLPVWPDGSVGVLEVWKTLEEVPESVLNGAPIPVMGDGIALDVHGNVYVAVLTRSAVVRLDLSDGTQETIAAFRVPTTLPLYGKLDFPASLFFGTGMGERNNLFVTNLGLGSSRVPGLPWVGSSLVKIDAGVPGRPIH